MGDKSIEAISGLKLKSIDLRATKITDQGLALLSKMGTLHSINVLQTAVTEDGVKMAKLALPKASISK